jgi:hypothetical protein
MSEHVTDAHSMVGPSTFYYDSLRAKHALDYVLPTVFSTGASVKFGKNDVSFDPNVMTKPVMRILARLLECIGWNARHADRRADSGRKFMLRLVGLPIEFQDRIFQLFLNVMEQIRASKKVDVRTIWED